MNQFQSDQTANITIKYKANNQSSEPSKQGRSKKKKSAERYTNKKAQRNQWGKTDREQFSTTVKRFNLEPSL